MTFSIDEKNGRGSLIPAIAIVVLVALAIVRSAIATRTDGFTLDEAWHITAGVSYVKTDSFVLNPEHPPLVKLWVGAAEAPSFRLPPFRPLADKVDERNFAESAVFLENDPDRVQVRARHAMFALNALLLLLLALAVSRALGTLAALCTVAFLAVDPTVAANLPIVMTDLSVGLLSVTAMLFTAQGLRSGKWLDVVLAALALGFTFGAKHSGLVALLAVGGYGIAVAFLPTPSARATTKMRTLALTGGILVGSLVVLWGLYGFHYNEARTREAAFNRPLPLKIEDVHAEFSRGALHAMVATHVLPRSYIWGLADTVRSGLEGRGIPVLLFGRVYRDSQAPVYFFPTVIAAKLPLGLLALASAGLVLVVARRIPQAWRVPTAGLLVLAFAFLIALARGVAYAGIRHALPVVIALAIFGGMTLAVTFASRSRWGMILAGIALAEAVASAVPCIRPWEYYNEVAGGPKNAYLHFADEGVDVGQRTEDFVRYYDQNLKPSGEIPYLFYPVAQSEMKRRDVLFRGGRGKGEGQIENSTDVSGIFFMRAMAVTRNPEAKVFREVPPTDRIGNLLIYRGTFHLPSLRENSLFGKAQQILYSPEPDLDKAEGYLNEIVKINPRSAGALLELGNIMLTRGRRPEALDYYQRALGQVKGSVRLRDTLTRQIDRLSSTEPLENIPRVRFVLE